MRLKAAAFVLLMATACSAYTGICFLDAILNGLDGIASRVDQALNPTTTTTTVPTTSTTSSTTTSTTESTTTTTTTTTSTSTTTTTLFPGKCGSPSDCPATEVKYSCDQDSHIMVSTTNYVCMNIGTPQSECKGRSTTRIHKACQGAEKCTTGLSECVKNWGP
jgi:hypothetical protein